MSEIITYDNHCALILSKEEALVVYALMGRLPCGSITEAARVFRTLRYSEFIPWKEYFAWWEKHEIKAKKDIECKEGDVLPEDSILLVNKK